MTASKVECTAWRSLVTEPVGALAWADAFDVLAVAELAGQVTLLDGFDGQILRHGASHDGGAFALAWQPRGQVLASGGGDGRVGLHDAAMLDPSFLDSALAWQPTGDLLASAGRDGGVALWAPGPHAHQSEPHRRLHLGARVTALAWSPDGTRAAAGTVEGAVVAVRSVAS